MSPVRLYGAAMGVRRRRRSRSSSGDTTTTAGIKCPCVRPPIRSEAELVALQISWWILSTWQYHEPERLPLKKQLLHAALLASVTVMPVSLNVG